MFTTYAPNENHNHALDFHNKEVSSAGANINGSSISPSARGNGVLDKDAAESDMNFNAQNISKFSYDTRVREKIHGHRSVVGASEDKSVFGDFSCNERNDPLAPPDEGHNATCSEWLRCRDNISE